MIFIKLNAEPGKGTGNGGAGNERLTGDSPQYKNGYKQINRLLARADKNGTKMTPAQADRIISSRTQPESMKRKKQTKGNNLNRGK